MAEEAEDTLTGEHAEETLRGRRRVRLAAGDQEQQDQCQGKAIPHSHDLSSLFRFRACIDWLCSGSLSMP